MDDKRAATVVGIGDVHLTTELGEKIRSRHTEAHSQGGPLCTEFVLQLSIGRKVER